MTLQTIREAAKGGYGGLDETTDDPTLTDVAWNRAINRGYRWLCKNARLIANTWAMVSVNGTREYTLANLSPGLAAIQFVQFKQGGATGRWQPLNKLPADQIAQVVSNFHDTTGAPVTYWTRADKLGLYPIPDATNAGALLEVWGWAFPAALITNGDTPAIDGNLHDWLIAPAQYERAVSEIGRGREDAEKVVARFERERQEALLECRAHTRMLTDTPEYVNWSEEDF